MDLEQVYSDQDSEDEVDDDIADFEDRRVCFGYHLNYFYFVFPLQGFFFFIFLTQIGLSVSSLIIASDKSLLAT